MSEFLKAFGKYKRVMTSVYPDRRAELDAYEDDIIDIYNFFLVQNFMIITSYSLPWLPFYCERKGLKWIGQSVIATLSHLYYQVYR